MDARNGHRQPPMLLAVDQGLDEIVEVLFKAGAKHGLSDFECGARIILAVVEKNPAMLRRLVTAGVSVNSFDYDNRTGLHLASAEGNLAFVEQLLSYGADPTFQDR